MSSMTASSSSSYVLYVDDVWDFENCWLPAGYAINTLRSQMETALQCYNPCFKLNSLIAHGPDGHKARMIHSTGIHVEYIGKPNMKCGAREPDALRSGSCRHLAIENRASGYERVLRKTDEADLYAAEDAYQRGFLQRKTCLSLVETWILLILKRIFSENELDNNDVIFINIVDRITINLFVDLMAPFSLDKKTFVHESIATANQHDIQNRSLIKKSKLSDTN